MIKFIRKINEHNDSKLLWQLDDFIYHGICNENNLSDLERKHCIIRVNQDDAYKFYSDSSYYCDVNHYVGMPRITLLYNVITGSCGIYLQNSVSNKTINIRKKNYIHLFFDYLRTMTGYRDEFYYRFNNESIYDRRYLEKYNYVKIDEKILTEKNSRLYYKTICNISNIFYSINREEYKNF